MATLKKKKALLSGTTVFVNNWTSKRAIYLFLILITHIVICKLEHTYTVPVLRGYSTFSSPVLQYSIDLYR